MRTKNDLEIYIINSYGTFGYITIVNNLTMGLIEFKNIRLTV